MNEYIATFHTHLAALRTHRTLTAKGIEARMAPVPRRISSSCGTCVFFQADEPCLLYMDEDTEAVYTLADSKKIWSNEE